MTDEELEEAVTECITNMVNSMRTWRPDLLLLFHQLYCGKFCIHCGRPREFYQGLPAPCLCEDGNVLPWYTS